MDSNGVWHWIETNAKVVSRTLDKRPKLIMGLDRDISARKQAEEYQRLQYQEAQRKFEICEAMRKTSNKVVSDLEQSKHLASAVEHLQQIIPFDFCEIYSLDQGNLQLRYEIAECRDCESIPDATLLIPELESSLYPIITDDLGPNVKYSSALALPLRNSGDLVGAVVMRHRQKGFFRSTDLYPIMAFADSLSVAIRNQLHFQKTIHELETDELTKFLTRRSFDRSMPGLWNKFLQMHRVNSLAMIDIDHFKLVNDTYGHQVGDQVIREISRLCIASLRKQDILGRYGGEEFIAVLPDTSLTAAHAIMNRIRIGCSEIVIPGIDQAITISIGISSCDQPIMSLDELIGKADAALYQAKIQGRNQVFGP